MKTNTGSGSAAAGETEKLTLKERATRLAFRSRRRIATGAAVLIAIFLGYHVVVGQNGLTVYQQKRLEDRTLSKQIQGLRAENTALQAHVDRLKNSPDAIEHEAREKLHYARQGEVIYTFDDEKRTDKVPGTVAAKTAADSPTP